MGINDDWCCCGWMDGSGIRTTFCCCVFNVQVRASLERNDVCFYLFGATVSWLGDVVCVIVCGHGRCVRSCLPGDDSLFG